MPAGVPASVRHFYPRPPRGGRRLACRCPGQRETFLSTPSARRATALTVCVSKPEKEFLSTPSARRATFCRWLYNTTIFISIHALREEGDFYAGYAGRTLNHFYPRPPRGGRPPLALDFLHRTVFLSTPSARRATAYHGRYEPGVYHFYPRPPRGGRLLELVSGCRVFLFLSTPSARRATRDSSGIDSA